MQFQSHFVTTRRSRIYLSLSIFVIFGIAFSYYHTFNSIPGLIPEFKAPSLWSSKPSKFWSSFAPLLAVAAPKCSPPERPPRSAVAHNRFYDSHWKLRSGESWLIDEFPFPNLLNMNDSDLQSMHDSHSLFVDLLTIKAPTLEYGKGTKGIVTSAGGSYFPVLIISILMLRRSGSTLPIEVFLTSPSEYEALCDSALPSLNAKCIVLSDLLIDTPHTFTIKTYQLKIFAILFSSFEELLFLDADNFPIYPPEDLFLSEPFTTHHLVLWPDYWTSTASPYFSTITGLDPVIIRTRPTIEAGQILISKKHHTKTLLLAAYYNVYNDYFYRMISQGGPGEGDKDTFAPAAMVLNSTFYTVESPPVNLGIRAAGGSAVIQYDPSNARPFFIHASWGTKLNALKKIETVRKWGSEEKSREMFGMDVERAVWGYMVQIACNSWEFGDWGGGNKSLTVVCEQSRKCFRDIFGMEWEDGGVGEEREEGFYGGEGFT